MIDKESANIDKEFAKLMIEKVMPPVIRHLLQEGLLNKERLKDKEYILNIINENSKLIDEIGAVTLIHDHFLQSAHEAITANRPEVAVVLIATAIEQMINIFYRQVLKEKKILSHDEITDLIRSSNNNAKLGWLLALVAEHEIGDEFRKEVAHLIELRNQIVHYKAIPSPLIDETPIEKHIQDFGLDRMMEIPSELSGILNDALENIRERTPDYKLAMEAAKLFAV